MTTIDDVIRLLNKFDTDKNSDISVLTSNVNTLTAANKARQQIISDQADRISNLNNQIEILTAQKVTLEGEIARLLDLIPEDANKTKH